MDKLLPKMFNQSRQIYTLVRRSLLKNYGRTVVSKYLKVFHIPPALESTLANVHEADRRVTTALKTNSYANRSHNCGDLTSANIGERVELVGWIQYQRMSKFIILRDAYGLVQLVIPDDRRDLSQVIDKALCESVVRAVGVVEPRPKSQINREMKSGEIEVVLDNLDTLSSVEKQLPFEIRQFNKAKEQLRMQYRYLDLRFSQMQKNLRLRSKVAMKMREFLINECDFVDVETPTLFRRTPGGAQEFIVPTQHPNKFYSLVQSPQQFKQLLMVGGIDRYFQIARCYRDEGSRSDRQPEFTQLDIEMSFVDEENIMRLTEDLISSSWPEELGSIAVPFQRISFEDAMELYGSDKPDLRIPYKLENLTDNVRSSDTLSRKTGMDYSDDFGTYAIVFPDADKLVSNATKKEWNELAHQKFSGTKLITVKILESSWKTKLNELLSEQVVNDIESRLNLRNRDVLFLAFGKKTIVQELLGTIRIVFTNLIESKGTKVREDGFKFHWVLDFPLFSKSELDGSLQSTHHPFTQPRAEDLEFLSSEPLKVRGLHYDLVLNGSEIAGGSIRIHDAKLQQQIMDMLNIDSSQMSYLLEALSSGAPPHGGIALGLDRYISILCNASSIRDVIAFPKTMEGRDLMSGAPVAISQAEKSLYHIKTTEK